MDTATRLNTVLSSIIAAERQYQRIPASVQLLAVSKGQSCDSILNAVAAGQRQFGENYLQEAMAKILNLSEHQLTWHFIGRLQRNKTRDIARYFDWVHSICDASIAQRLNDQRPADHLPLQCCLQVNVDADPDKAGITRAEVLPLAKQFVNWPRLQLRGLMTLGRAQAKAQEQSAGFALLNASYLELQQHGLSPDTLSMGTSRDYTRAIAEGATLVRVGNAVFGARDER